MTLSDLRVVWVAPKHPDSDSVHYKIALIGCFGLRAYPGDAGNGGDRSERRGRG